MSHAKEKIKNNFILPNLKDNEQLYGFCMGQRMPPLWYVLLRGEGAYLKTEGYYLACTDQGLHLHKLDILGGSKARKFYAWEDILSLQIKKGVLKVPISLQFSDGTKVKIGLFAKGKMAMDDQLRQSLQARQK